MKNTIAWMLVLAMYIGLTLLYGGAGWCVAWVLDAGLNVTVNYKVFVWVGVGVFWLKAIPFILIKLFLFFTNIK